ncbi:MAG: phosphatase PAP2 family protein [Methylobacteriaceae bacterium]|nr:phosphatase PAP2 family protein [Methylobacteriaceae bacterium]
MAAVTISATVLDPSLKAFFGHPRPDNAYHYVQMTSFSFPSGHSLLAMATWFSLAMLAMYYSRRPLTRAFAVFYGLLIPTLVGFSRVYLGVHWPSDVFAGLGLGLALVLFWYLLIMTTFPETDYQDVTK